MRIFAAADIHGNPCHLRTIREEIRETGADVLVIAGDILQYGCGRQILPGLNALPLPVMMVRGNSDPPFVERIAQVQDNLHGLHLNAFSLNGFDFVGVSGTLPLPFYSLAGWREPRTLRRLAPLLHPRSILVAHPPPYGCRDRVLGRFSAGSRGLTRLIHQTAPAVMICGHIHEDAGVDRLGATLVVNCALGSGRRGALIVVEEGRPPRAELR